MRPHYSPNMSSPSGAYQAFLADPAADAMADNAALHYITTLTSIHGPAAIIKHLIVQAKLLKKSNKVLSVMECPDKTCMDVDTTIEFVAGGGAYLPGLDDNFVTDRTAIFPIVCWLSSLGRLIFYRRLTILFAAPSCLLRFQRQNLADPSVLGPRLASETNRSHRCPRPRLAHS